MRRCVATRRSPSSPRISKSTPNQVTQWKGQLLERAASAFGGEGPTPDSAATIRALQTKIGELTMENDFFQKVRSTKRAWERKAMIDRNQELPVVRQCEVLDLARSTAYYQPLPLPEAGSDALAPVDQPAPEVALSGYPQAARFAPQGRLRSRPQARRDVDAQDGNRDAVLAWRTSNTLTTDFCVAALEGGLDPVRGTPDLQHRPRQPVHEPGIHRAAAGARLHISMDGKGCWVDNVFVERLWRSLKYEDIYLKAYASIAEANRGIGVYFDFYNSFRPHQSLPERMTPDELRHAADESRGIMPVISHRVARCVPGVRHARAAVENTSRSSSLIRLGFLSNQTGQLSPRRHGDGCGSERASVRNTGASARERGSCGGEPARDAAMTPDQARYQRYDTTFLIGFFRRRAAIRRWLNRPIRGYSRHRRSPWERWAARTRAALGSTVAPVGRA